MSSKEEGDLRELLLGLEHQLMDPAFRKDRVRVSALLAEEFREFGSSGRVWTKETTLDLLAEETAFIAPQVEDFLAQRIAPDVVLVTYRTVPVGSGNASLRSSIWIDRDGSWRMLFHQGTKISGPQCSDSI
jgi:hypothetical protein